MSQVCTCCNQAMEFMRRIDFPIEAQAYFQGLMKRLEALPSLQTRLEQIVQRFFDHRASTIASLVPELDALAEAAEANRFSIHMLFLLYGAEPLKALYQQKNMPEDIYWNTCQDLRYKLLECRQVKGIWGTVTIRWFEGFYRMERFALGRMQYGITTFPVDEFTKAGVTVRKGDICHDMHIPSSGPLTWEKRLDSYKRAYAFFQDELHGKPLVITCHSWLLYPDNAQIFPRGSNMLDFMKDFTILEHRDYEGFPEACRVFGRDWTGPLNELPDETRLQRNIIRWLKQGRPMGDGFGVILFDGEKIL